VGGCTRPIWRAQPLRRDTNGPFHGDDRSDVEFWTPGQPVGYGGQDEAINRALSVLLSLFVRSVPHDRDSDESPQRMTAILTADARRYLRLTAPQPGRCKKRVAAARGALRVE